MKFMFKITTFVIITMISISMYSGDYIAIVKSNDLKAYSEPISSFTEDLKKFCDYPVKIFDIEGRLKKGLEIIKEFESNPPLLIYALGAKAAYLVKNKQEKIPVVFAIVLNWEKYKLKADHVTGISLEIPPEVLFTQIQLVLPEKTKIGVIYNPKTTGNIVKEANTFLTESGFELVTLSVNESSEVIDAFKDNYSKFEILWLPADPVVMTSDNFKELIEFSEEYNIPTLAYSENFVKGGATLSLSPSYLTIGSQSASIVREILISKISPKDIKVADPIGTYFVVNKIQLKKLGIQLDESLTQFIDKIIGKEE